MIIICFELLMLRFFPPKSAATSTHKTQNTMLTMAAVNGSTQEEQWRLTHAHSAANHCCENLQQERTTMRTRYHHFFPAIALTMLLCGRLASGGRFLSTNSNRRLRGFDPFQDFTNGSDVVDVVDDMCDGRPRNGSLTWGHHDEDWHTQCHLHWKEADNVSPGGQWTQTEFINFVQLQIHTSFTEFKQLPLPLTMIFNELSCRCVEHSSSDCCHGANAKIVPDTNAVDQWMDAVCNRVDNALDEVCRRQQKRAQGSEL